MPFTHLLKSASIAGAVSFLAFMNMATAQDHSTSIVQTDLGQLKHNEIPALPGVSNAFVLGSFDKAGLYAAHGIMRQGSKFPPHKHPDVRLTIVTSGIMYLGQGETFDESKLVAYPVGTVAITPANTHHYMYAKDGDVTVMEIGSGPSGATFSKIDGS